jgi:hypothetical protein
MSQRPSTALPHWASRARPQREIPVPDRLSTALVSASDSFDNQERDKLFAAARMIRSRRPRDSEQALQRLADRTSVDLTASPLTGDDRAELLASWGKDWGENHQRSPVTWMCSSDHPRRALLSVLTQLLALALCGWIWQAPHSMGMLRWLVGVSVFGGLVALIGLVLAGLRWWLPSRLRNEHWRMAIAVAVFFTWMMIAVVLIIHSEQCLH